MAIRRVGARGLQKVSQDFLGGELGEQSGNGRVLPGRQEIRGELGEGLEDEAAEMRARMGKDEECRVPDFSAPGDEVEVEGAGLVEDRFRPAAGVDLKGLELGEQRLRGLFCAGKELHDGVDEEWRTRRAIHRRAGPERGTSDREAGNGIQPVHGLAHDRGGIAQVRTEGNEDAIRGHGWEGLLQSEDVLHVVDTGGTAGDPGGSAQGTVGEGVTVAGLVGEFDAFAIGGEDDGMVADDVSATDGMDADLGSSAFAGDALAAVAEGFSELDLADLAEDLQKGGGCTAGGILLEAVMHLDDLQIESGSEDLGGLAG